MKTLKVFCLATIFIHLSCNNQTTSESENSLSNPDNPGPITESDKNRYNLNPNDEVKYGTLDSVMQDSIKQDSLENH